MDYKQNFPKFEWDHWGKGFYEFHFPLLHSNHTLRKRGPLRLNRLQVANSKICTKPLSQSVLCGRFALLDYTQITPDLTNLNWPARPDRPNLTCLTNLTWSDRPDLTWPDMIGLTWPRHDLVWLDLMDQTFSNVPSLPDLTCPTWLHLTDLTWPDRPDLIDLTWPE